jgi:outer membrane protein assembly factor BamB
MKTLWLKNPDHGIVSTGLSNDDRNYSYASSAKEITVYDNNSGETKWSKKFCDISPKLGKVDDIIPMWKSDVIILADRKMGRDQLAGVDVNTGNLLWITDRYQGVSDDNIDYLPQTKGFIIGTKDALVLMDSRNGELIWQTTRFKGAAGKFVETQDGNLVILNYKAGSMAALFSGFKNQIMKISLKTGEVAWEQTYRGALERKVITREALCGLNVAEGSVALQLNGIQVFDYATGLPKWHAAFDETPAVLRRPGGYGRITSFGAYGTVADPIIEGDHVYVLDFQNRRKQYIKKYNRLNGELVWTSPEIDDAKVVPGMFLHKGIIILQVGGTIELQYRYTKNNPDGSTTTGWVIDFDEYGPYNLQAFDGTTGKQIWQSEKLKKGVSNSFMDADNVVVCSGKALYSIDYATGKENYEVPLSKDKIGQAIYVLNYKDKAAIVGQKGVSLHNKVDGTLALEAKKYKRATPVRINGNMIFGNSLALRNTDGDYAVYNLDSGVFNKYDGRTNAQAILSDDGSSLYVFESGNMMRKSKVTKFATR